MKTDKDVLPKNVYLVANSQIFPIRNIISKLGRKLENDLVIQESMVSRFHAEILFEDDKYFLIDKNSTGGTYLNNKKINKAQLVSGDTIMLANIPLLFLVESNELQNKTTTTTETLKSGVKEESTKENDSTKPYQNNPV